MYLRRPQRTQSACVWRSLQWESMNMNSFRLISVMGFVLDESAALCLLTTIPLSLHAYGFSPLLLILFFSIKYISHMR